MMNRYVGFLFGLVCAVSVQGCSDARVVPSVEPEKTLSLKISAYCPTPGYRFSEIYATNLSSQLEGEDLVADSDRDGLSDQYEQSAELRNTYNISEVTSDTNEDGYSDLVMVNLGYGTETQQSLSYCDSVNQDFDRDLLDDCVEALIGTDIKNPDSDKDGIPDGLEFRYGLNPSDAEDSKTDIDQDGLNALSELKINTPVKITNSKKSSAQSIQYSVGKLTNSEDEECYSIEVGNIVASDVENGNYIRVIFLETTTIAEQGDVSIIRDVSVVIESALIDQANKPFAIASVNNQTEVFQSE